MGPVRLDWQQVPLTSPQDTLAVDIGGPVPAVCHSMGNPHAVLFVDDAESVDLARLGPLLEHHPLFPDRAQYPLFTSLVKAAFGCASGNVAAVLRMLAAVAPVRLGWRLRGPGMARGTMKS